MRRAELLAILAAEQPARIYATPTIYEPIDHTLTFQRESAYIRILDRLWPDVHWLGEPTRPKQTAKMVRPWFQWKRIWRAVKRRRAAQVPVGPPEAPGILVLHDTPDLTALKHDTARTFRWIPSRTLSLPDRLIVHPFCPRSDWPRYDPVVDPRIQFFVQESLSEMIRTAHETDHVLVRDRISLVCSGMPGATPTYRAVAGRARVQGVPYVLLQHGGAYGYLSHPIHYYNDLAQCDHWLAYGDGVIEGLRQQFAGLPLPQMHAIGSAALSQLQARRSR